MLLTFLPHENKSNPSTKGINTGPPYTLILDHWVKQGKSLGYWHRKPMLACFSLWQHQRPTLEMYTANKRYKSEELSSFSYPNLKLTAPTVLLSATEDVTIVASNIQQFRFLFQTQNKDHKRFRAARGRRRKHVLGVALKLTRLSLCSNYWTKDNPEGPLSRPVQEANSFVFDQIHTVLSIADVQ